MTVEQRLALVIGELTISGAKQAVETAALNQRLLEAHRKQVELEAEIAALKKSENDSKS